MSTTYQSGNIESGLKGQYDVDLKSILSLAWENVSGSKAAFVSGQLMALCAILFSALLTMIVVIALAFVFPPAFHLVNVLPSCVGGAIGICSMAFLNRIAFKKFTGRSVNAKGYFKVLKRFWPGLAVYIFQFVVLLIIGGIMTIIFFGYVLLVLGQIPNEAAHQAVHGTEALILGLGMVVCVAIAIILNSFFVTLANLTIPVAMDRHIGFFFAFKLLFAAMRRRYFSIIWLNTVIMAICLVSMIPFGLGLIWTMPLAFNANAILYDRMFGIKMDAKEA